MTGDLGKYSLCELFWYAWRQLTFDKLLLIWGNLRFSLKCCFWGIRKGKNVRAWGRVDVATSSKESIQIGNDVSLISSSRRCAAASLYAPIKLRTFKRSARIIIGNGVSLSGTSIAARSTTVSIGDGTMVAPNVTIMDTDFHALWPPKNRALNPAYENDADVTIGKNVWLGANAIILKGAVIGDNSVIGAGSVVTGIIPQNCLAAGNPAKVIKELDKNE